MNFLFFKMSENSDKMSITISFKFLSSVLPDQQSESVWLRSGDREGHSIWFISFLYSLVRSVRLCDLYLPLLCFSTHLILYFSPVCIVLIFSPGGASTVGVLDCQGASGCVVWPQVDCLWSWAAHLSISSSSYLAYCSACLAENPTWWEIFH